MKVITLPDVLHEYLVHVIQKHSGQGIHPEEGLAVSQLWQAIAKAQHIADADIAKMVQAATPQGQSTPATPETEPSHLVDNLKGGTITVECQSCWDNEGSQACIRPAHQKKA